MSQLNIFKRNQKGDTIVEVLASIAVVGVALAGGYALSSHSLRTGIDASRRSEALSLAQGQVEFLKNAVINNSTAQYTDNATIDFCINSTTGAKLTGAPCSNLNGTTYAVSIVYSGDPDKTFTIEPTWESFGSNEPGRMRLYYKLPDNF